MIDKKHLISPWALLKALSAPFVIWIGLPTLLFLTLPLLAGVDPLPIAGGFLKASIRELAQLIQVLIAGWLYYAAVYAAGVYFTPKLFLSIVWYSAQAGLIASSRYSALPGHSSTWPIVPRSNSLRRPFVTEILEHLGTRWHPALNGQLK